tara:strand:+ start:590 stop:1390 length:801 start_codon:yes stop_codon:yes gene_type:complete
MFKNIVLFLHKEGQKKIGVDKAPLLIKKNINSKNLYKIRSMNNIYKNLENLYDNNKSINEPILNIGGDHSMAISTVADSLNKHKNLKLIWIDAHCDINTYQSSITKNFHGMPLSILTGLDIQTRHSFDFLNKTRLLDFKDILYIGIRDIDPYEIHILDKYNIKSISSHEVNNKPYNVLKTINNFVKNNPVHISFDVDSIDPTYIPSTGTSVKGGINIDSMNTIFKNINKKNIVSMDFTELNLTIGNDKEKDISLQNSLKLLNNFCI